MLFLIAWRNIWRNRKRTLITSGSVFFAIILAVFMRSATDGVYEGMIQNVVSFSSGYIQLHAKGYWDERSVDNSLKVTDTLINQLSKEEGVLHCTRRMESFALASAGNKTRGIAFIGIEPDKEIKAGKLQERIVSGNYFSSGYDKGILIGEGMAKYFGIGVGDSLILISQGYHAASAAAILPVRGVLALGSPQLNDNLVYMSLLQSQQFLSADSLCTSVSLYLENVNQLESVSDRIKNNYGSAGVEVMTWKEMLPEMDQFITADKGGHLIVIAILYLVISFGLYSTVLMMIYERQHEFGILVSIGMKKRLLMLIVFLETLFVTFVGALFGMIASFSVMLYFHFHPIRFTGNLKEVYERYGMEAIISMSMKPSIFYYQALIVFLLAVLVSIYPSLKILRLKPIEAMRS